MKKLVIEKYIKHFIIYFISFCINYLIFIIFMLFSNASNAIALSLINLFSWIVSMLFIFYIDRKYVPDLVDENNSRELFKFILIRFFGLIAESLILFIFITILRNNYYFVKFVSLVLLFILNSFYVHYVQFKD